MDAEQKWSDLQKKYHSQIYNDDYWPMVHGIQKDLKFFEEFTNRFKEVKFFNYRISLSCGNLIYDFFCRGAQDYLQYEKFEHTQTFLAVFNVALHLIENWKEKSDTEWVANAEIVSDIIELDAVICYYFGGNSFWWLSSFIGSNYEQNELQKAIQSYFSATAKNPEGGAK